MNPNDVMGLLLHCMPPDHSFPNHLLIFLKKLRDG